MREAGRQAGRQARSTIQDDRNDDRAKGNGLSGQGDRGESREGDRGVGGGWLQRADGLVSRTVLLRGGLGWLAVRRGWRGRRRLWVYLVGQESVRLHVSRMMMVVLMVMGVEDRLGGGRGAGGADADTDADSDADRVRERRRGDRRWRSGRRRRSHRHRDTSGRSGSSGRLVIQYRHPDQPLCRVRHVCRLEFRGQLPLPLVTTVLEPDLHLSLGQPQRRGQTGAFRRRKVAFHVERALQLEHLRPREHCPRLLLSFHATRVATVHANLHAVLSAAAAAAAAAAIPCTTAATTVKARRIRGFPLAVRVRAVVLLA